MRFIDIFNIFKKPRPSLLLLQQKGQGAIEYILLMTVGVAIILGIVSQFNKSFGQWAENYFGEYISCILETGEMPSLGGGGGANSSVCASSFEPFTMAEGRAPKSQDSSSSGGSSGLSSSRGKKFKSSPGGSSGGNSDSGSSGGATPKGGSQFIGGGSSGNGGGQFKNQSSIEKGTDSKGDGVNNVTKINGTGRSGGDERILRSKIRSNTEVELRKKNKGRAKVVTRVKATNSENKGKRFLASKKALKKSVVDADVSLGFGDYLRYLIIIAIILIIVLFFGMQAMQISKSMD
ncbi:MAG: hypothetical protein HOO06_02190 [Bdellovibrionaceae bacterium]|jgi:hypothetical protein|nr:hypothetical protein [Pseudobdellovibrionaceae bacterium]